MSDNPEGRMPLAAAPLSAGFSAEAFAALPALPCLLASYRAHFGLANEE
ncbi:MAG TPA: hypothetical protein VMG36_00580 [Thermoplasmata archaeon]|nr:hypothetical protein [Thermoplasmata archaeon]